MQNNKLINLCASADRNSLPANVVDGILLNLIEDCGSSSAIVRTRELLKKSKPKKVILDNSGYNLLTAENNGKKVIHDASKPLGEKQGVFNVTPLHYVTAVAEIQPDYMICPDWPIRKFENQLEREQEFRRKLDINVKWVKETVKLREVYCPDVGLLIPIQAYTLKQLEIFLKSISPISCVGFCMPIRTQPLGVTALFFIRLWQLKVRFLHLLGVSALFPMALAAYMARHFYQMVSLDARTWKIRAMNSEYLHPQSYSWIKINNETLHNDRLIETCSCPWCKKRTMSYFTNLPYYHRRIVLGCHNFWATQKMGDDLFENAGSIGSLISFLNQRSSRKDEIAELKTILSVIQLFKNKDIRYLEDFLS